MNKSTGYSNAYHPVVPSIFPRDAQFLLMTALSFLGTIAGSLFTLPTPTPVFQHFYRTTRPFGWWKPLGGKDTFTLAQAETVSPETTG